MKRFAVLLLLCIPAVLFAQSKMKTRNYPSLLWEISGNGMRKPSYLFGTMHVSSKLAFHLADSFYIGIRNADVVALETNPESWQEDMSKYDLGDRNEYGRYRMNYSGDQGPDDYLHMSTLRFYKYDSKIERALYSNPSTINNLLYRSYGNASSDFEEDTYLDMYIYQCGKKWGKKVAGVEKYGESMKLMEEAYRDAARDKNKKDRSYDREEGYSSGKLQEAYRTGNLDWLDSINRYNSFSEAFDEKFLYRRNEIQAGSIDSILRSGKSLFVGVGAAHLPGSRGVIEILRKAGYRLRPVKMGARDSQHKNQVEKLRVPVVFSTQTADDGFFKVDIPGKFYKFGEEPNMDQRQYADMANGSYYMVSRIMTNAWMWGHSTDRVRKIVDSLLYENVPGKIIRKTAIIRNGYHGIDLVNKTRRGDIQRYNIFTTPFEVIIFKMSGTGEYVTLGEEAQRFFNSIQLKEYRTGEAAISNWKKYSPPYGGFSIDMPHEPYIGNDGSWIFDAEDKTTSTQYRVIRTDIHNYHFVEEDTFDLGLMDESFAASDFIDKQLSRQQKKVNGYPALDCRYKDKNGSIYLVRFLIQGTHYYTLVAHGKQELPVMKSFISSFSIKPIAYPMATLKTDTALYYHVKTPVFPVADKEKLDLPAPGYLQDDDDDGNADPEAGVFRSKLIKNDTTGEKIFVNFFRSPRYTFLEDSSVLDKENFFGDTTSIVLKKVKGSLPNGMKTWESVLTDTGSSRTIWSKMFYKDGIGFSITTQGDTLTAASPFVQGFFDSFTPADTLRGTDMFAKKSTLFFADFMSKDSIAHRRAIKGIYLIKLDSADIPDIRKAVASLTWAEKNYLDTKKSLIRKVSTIDGAAAAVYLKDLYQAAGDTLELQYAVLESLLRQRSAYSYRIFRDIVMAEPPVMNLNTDNRRTASVDYYDRAGSTNLLGGLSDSLKLTRTILPDILPLINLDDYKYPVMSLLGEMVDSGLVKRDDYKLYYSKFLLEAKQEWRRQVLAEKQKSIHKAKEELKGEDPGYFSYRNENVEEDGGNDNLALYATLLIPYWDNDPQVPALLNQMLASSDKRLKYSILLSLIRANKPFPDTLLDYFAGLDEYRYELYEDLSGMDKLFRFPAKANKQLLLAHSKLLSEDGYAKPDSVVFLDKLKAEVKGREGWVYFFKYKNRKDDVTWKIASVGLVPTDSTKFEWQTGLADTDDDDDSPGVVDQFDFTGFSNIKLKEDEAVASQLDKELKRMLYLKRKSAREFYDRSGTSEYEDVMVNIEDGDN